MTCSQSLARGASVPAPAKAFATLFCATAAPATRDMEIAIAQMVAMRILCFILSKVAVSESQVRFTVLAFSMGPFGVG